jgi:lipid A oxidase
MRDDSKAGMKTKTLRLALAFSLVLLGGTAGAQAEIVASVFGGAAITEDNDLRLRQSGGTDLTFHGVSYQGKDFETPPYYGARLSYFLSRESHWGFGLEFFHAKLFLNAGETVHVTGIRGGVPVDGNEPVNATIDAFSISHGLNFLTADAIYRWFLGERGKEFLGRFQPYVGLGAGAVIPHVESSVGGVSFQEYQWHGPGVQAFVGMNFDLTRYLSLFFEYKFSYADLDSLSIPGGSISLTPWMHHLVTGISVRF